MDGFPRESNTAGSCALLVRVLLRKQKVTGCKMIGDKPTAIKVVAARL